MNMSNKQKHEIMTTQKIKKEITKAFNFEIGKERNESLSYMDVKNNGKYASMMVEPTVIKRGVIVKKVYGFNEIRVDLMPLMKDFGGYNDCSEQTKKVNEYLLSQGYKTQYHGGCEFLIVW